MHKVDYYLNLAKQHGAERVIRLLLEIIRDYQAEIEKRDKRKKGES